MATKKKYYTVWAGYETGVFDSWDECQLVTEGYPGARFKAFPTRDAAINAYRSQGEDSGADLLKAIAEHATVSFNPAALPGVDPNGITVDGATSRNPGPTEYRGVDLATDTVIFHAGPFENGTNNIGEFLAIVHALAMLDKEGRRNVTVYSDSRTAIAWTRRRKANTTIAPSPANERIRSLIARAEAWLAAHPVHNPVVKWDTEAWGEIPADFGRK